jgi:hypothetical protein
MIPEGIGAGIHPAPVEIKFDFRCELNPLVVVGFGVRVHPDPASGRRRAPRTNTESITKDFIRQIRFIR